MILSVMFCEQAIVSRGCWLSKASNIKHKNKGAAVYVGSSPALYDPLFFWSKSCY